MLPELLETDEIIFLQKNRKINCDNCNNNITDEK